MSNVFGNTDSMLQNLGAARSQLEQSKVNVLEDKEKPELIGKTLNMLFRKLKVESNKQKVK